MGVLLLVCLALVGSASAAAQRAPSNGVDRECMLPPPGDVDPITCCKMPEMLDSSHIEGCVKKTVKGGPAPEAPNNPEGFFSQPIRVSRHNSKPNIYLPK